MTERGCATTPSVQGLGETGSDVGKQGEAVCCPPNKGPGAGSPELIPIYRGSLRGITERLLIPPAPATHLTSPATAVMISYLASFHVKAAQDPPS